MVVGGDWSMVHVLRRIVFGCTTLEGLVSS
jgi:hypothetical protein